MGFGAKDPSICAVPVPSERVQVSFGGCDADVLGTRRLGAGKILPHEATSLADTHVHGASGSAGWCQCPSW